jgi:aromatic ring-opening dioxygenase catalytic subunit (LigB family)
MQCPFPTCVFLLSFILILVKSLICGVHQPDERKNALIDLTRHAGFRASHPREDHFVPLYVAAGAGEGGDVCIIESLYGQPTFAFGL